MFCSWKWLSGLNHPLSYERNYSWSYSTMLNSVWSLMVIGFVTGRPRKPIQYRWKKKWLCHFHLFHQSKGPHWYLRSTKKLMGHRRKASNIADPGRALCPAVPFRATRKANLKISRMLKLYPSRNKKFTFQIKEASMEEARRKVAHSLTPKRKSHSRATQNTP